MVKDYKKWLKKFEQDAEKNLEAGRTYTNLHKNNCEKYMLFMQKEKGRHNRR